MALRKDPQRRYESAAQLSADIERHLTGLPVIEFDTLFRRSVLRSREHLDYWRWVVSTGGGTCRP